MRTLTRLNIIDIAVSFPPSEQRIEDAATQLVLTPTELKMFKRYYGFEHFRIDDPQPPAELLDAAMTTLTARNPHIRSDLKILGHCHTISDIATFGPDPLHWL